MTPNDYQNKDVCKKLKLKILKFSRIFSFELPTPNFKSKEQILVLEKWLLQPSVFTINMDIANLVKGAEDIISMSFVKIAHA